MSNRCIPLTLCAATAIPFGLLGGFGSTGDHSILPWGGMFAGWAAWVLVARWGISRGWWLVAHENKPAPGLGPGKGKAKASFLRSARVRTMGPFPASFGTPDRRHCVILAYPTARARAGLVTR